MMSPEEKKYTILTCYYRPKPGGFCKRFFRAIHALLDRGHTVHYLAVVPFPIDHPNCHFHRFPWPREHTSGYVFWAFFHLLAPVQLLYLGFRYNINRLFAFGGHNYALFLQPLRIVKRIPLTLFLRGDALQNHQLKGHPRILIELEHFLEGVGIAGTRLYGVSGTLTNKTIARHKLFKPSTSGVLRNDIVGDCPVPKNQIEFHLPLKLACVGLLEPRKNQSFLLEVMRGFKAEQVQLSLYGEGPNEQLLKDTVEKENLQDRVHFMGWVAAEKIWPQVDLLLMASLHEGAPNAVLEALGNGVPVIASNIPEHTEILPENYLVQLGKVANWVEVIERILLEPKRQLQNIICVQQEETQCLLFDWNPSVVNCIIDSA